MKMHLLLALFLLGACGDDTEAEDSFVPPDYAERYTEVRDCRRSTDHDSMYIRVLASPDSLDAYRAGRMGIAEGAILVKEEHATPECNDLVSLTAMRKDGPLSHPDSMDWLFQRSSLTFRVDNQTARGEPNRCVTCHRSCDGFVEFTCTME